MMSRSTWLRPQEGRCAAARLAFGLGLLLLVQTGGLVGCNSDREPVTVEALSASLTEDPSAILAPTDVPSDGRGAGGVPRADDSYDLVIDGLLGYSLDGAPRDLAADMIRWTRRSSARVLALDTPSGVDASSGAVFDPALRAITRWRRRWSGR